MDILFHAVSAGTLAYCLGERRQKYIVAAGIIGCLPDIMWPFAHIDPSCRWLYSLSHSLILNLILCGIICLFNWRIAFGGLLHITIDALTHASSTKHMLFPFSRAILFPGLSWWHWPGLILWIILWAGLIAIMIYILKKNKHRVAI